MQRLFREYQEAIGVDLCFQSFQEELENLAGRYAVVLLLEQEGALVGCAALARRGEEVGELKRLYVAAGVQGKGYGKALLEEALQVAQEMGLRRVILDTIEAKMPRAVAMYRQRGFVEVGRRSAGGQELLDMELVLSS